MEDLLLGLFSKMFQSKFEILKTISTLSAEAERQAQSQCLRCLTLI